MKLSEYIHSKLGPPHAILWRFRKVEQIEEWIVEWYRSEFNEIGGKPREIPLIPVTYLDCSAISDLGLDPRQASGSFLWKTRPK